MSRVMSAEAVSPKKRGAESDDEDEYRKRTREDQPGNHEEQPDDKEEQEDQSSDQEEKHPVAFDYECILVLHDLDENSIFSYCLNKEQYEKIRDQVDTVIDIQNVAPINYFDPRIVDAHHILHALCACSGRCPGFGKVAQMTCVCEPPMMASDYDPRRTARITLFGILNSEMDDQNYEHKQADYLNYYKDE